jgi:hypothetical protein
MVDLAGRTPVSTLVVRACAVEPLLELLPEELELLEDELEPPEEDELLDELDELEPLEDELPEEDEEELPDEGPSLLLQAESVESVSDAASTASSLWLFMAS